MSIKEKIITCVKETEIAKLLKEVIAIPSESGYESNLCDYLTELFEGTKFEIKRDKHGNFFAILNAGQPTVLLNTHIDTVAAGEGWDYDPFKGVIENGHIYGRGACDAKGSLVAMVTAALTISKLKMKSKGSLVLMCAVKEEVSPPSEKGTMKAIIDGLKADMAIVGEPTDLTACIGEFGRVEYEITTSGISSHANAPEQGINAITKMAKLVNELENKIDRPYNELLGRNGTFNVGVINGGIQSNVVPGKCTILVDRGLVPGQTPQESLKEILEIAETVKKVDKDFVYNVKTTYEGYPACVGEDEIIVRRLIKNIDYLTNTRNTPKGFVSHCDADWLITYGKIPSVIFGPGSLKDAHKANESIKITDVVKASQILALTICDLIF